MVLYYTKWSLMVPDPSVESQNDWLSTAHDNEAQIKNLSAFVALVQAFLMPDIGVRK